MGVPIYFEWVWLQWEHGLMMSVHSNVPGVKKEVLYAGKEPSPDFVKNSKAIFHFKTIRLLSDGSLPDEWEDKVIDDTHALGTGPFELLIGREFKLDIWEKLVKEMLIGEIARFSCPYKMISEYPTISQALRKLSKQKHACNHDDDGHDHTHQCGYSALMYGTGHRDLDEITNNKTPLAFEIELLKVEGPEDYKKESWAMTDDEKYQLIPRLKEEGNQFYKSGLIIEASDKYSEALGYLESFSIREKPGSGQWNKIESDKIPFLLNYSQCQLMLGNYFDVIRYTGQVLEFDPNNVKALYRRGRAYSATWSNEEAERDFMKALGLDESLKKSVDKELTILKDKMKLKNKEDRLKLQGKLFI